ncbi:transposase [Candidatus Peregrinibacteria bacterium]|nr:transposase [Candidatus Peregrinibacteria bacterium]
MIKKHRDSQKRIHFEDAVYFVSCKTENGHPYFKESIFCDLFVENLRICKKLKGFYLYGWVLLHNHFHLLIRPSDNFNISEVMRSLKTSISCDINRIQSPESAVPAPRFREIYRNKFDITDYQKQFQKNHPTQIPYPKPCLPAGRFQWQKSYQDHYIRNDQDFDYHMDNSF